MRFDPPLIEATLLRRYKRFLADVRRADGAEQTVHCPNSGAMLGVAPSGARCWIWPANNPKRKLSHTLELVEVDGGLVGINTHRPNSLAAEAIADNVVTELAGHTDMRREVRYQHDDETSRFDIALTDSAGRAAFIEVKNVHLRRHGELAEFPDSVTARGAKHLTALAHAARHGARAIQLFVIQRTDCDRLALADDIDPAYAQAFASARAAGVEALAYACDVSPVAVTIARPVPICEPVRA